MGRELWGSKVRTGPGYELTRMEFWLDPAGSVGHTVGVDGRQYLYSQHTHKHTIPNAGNWELANGSYWL